MTNVEYHLISDIWLFLDQYTTHVCWCQHIARVLFRYFRHPPLTRDFARRLNRFDFNSETVNPADWNILNPPVYSLPYKIWYRKTNSLVIGSFGMNNIIESDTSCGWRNVDYSVLTTFLQVAQATNSLYRTKEGQTHGKWMSVVWCPYKLVISSHGRQLPRKRTCLVWSLYITVGKNADSSSV